MPTYRIDVVCQVCGAPWSELTEGTDEGDALFRFIAKAGRSRCQSCTTMGQFELQRSSLVEDKEEPPRETNLE